MDSRLYLQTVTAVQSVLALEKSELEVDGKWGNFTQSIYDSVSPQTKLRADAIITALVPGSKASDLARYRQLEKQKGQSPAAVSTGTAKWPQVAALISSRARERGYANPQLLVAQAAHESRFGASALSALHNNFGGLKAGIKPNRANGVVRMRTSEGHGSSRSTVMAPFLSFATPDDWVTTQLDYLERKSAGAIKRVSTAKDFTALMKSFGYFTDSGANYLAGLNGALSVA